MFAKFVRAFELVIEKMPRSSKRIKLQSTSDGDQNFTGLKKIRSNKNKILKKSALSETHTFPQCSSDWLEKAENSLGPLAAKIASSTKYVGAHVTITGGIDKAPLAAVEIGCRAFGLFLRNQRTWKLSTDVNQQTAENFRQNCSKFSFSPNHIVPHGSYLLNAGSPNEETLKKTRATLLHEVRMCEKLGLTLYNFHPGSSCGKISTDECIKLIAESINLVLRETKGVTLVVEAMAGQGSTVGGTFEQLKSIIDQIEDQSRIGVCLDTCHIFAAGYDIRKKTDYEKVTQKFAEIVGFKYLKAIHLNDSKGELNSNLDRHENIGRGFLGKETFAHLMQDNRLDNIPMILETPAEMSDTEEILLLYSL